MKQMHAGTLVRAAGRGRPYADADRVRAVEYATRRREEGAGMVRVAREIGISRVTLKKWLVGNAFARVEIATAPGAYTVHAPHGVRIDGLTLEEIGELLRRLD
jgi:hypothetical protein